MKIMVSTTTVREIYQFLKNKKKKSASLPDSIMDCLLGCLDILSVLVARVAVQEYNRKGL